MKIEKTQISDLQEIISLEEECFTPPYNKEMLKKMINDCIFLKATSEDNQIIGYICLEKVLDEAELIKIAVKKQFRNQNIGSMLLNSAIDLIKKQVKKIFLEVNETNSSAISFYNNREFKLVFVRKKYYNDKSALIMQRDL